MGNWFDPNIQKTHGPRISKELAEALGVFDTSTGLRRKPDGSLEVLWNADTPKDQRKVQQHLQIDEVDGKIRITDQGGAVHTFADAFSARQYVDEQLGENVQFRKNGPGLLASRNG
jgi:hypothetical protein